MSKKILIIEDSPTVLNMLKSVFEGEGYEIVTALTGEEGLEKQQDQTPDLIILDTVLPGIDGFEVCKKIREDKDSEALKIIIMTGNVDAIDAMKALEVGADDYCAKTTDFSPIVEAVKKLGAKYLFFHDDTFNLGIPRTLEIARALKKMDIEYAIQCRVRPVNKEMIECLKTVQFPNQPLRARERQRNGRYCYGG